MSCLHSDRAVVDAGDPRFSHGCEGPRAPIQDMPERSRNRGDSSRAQTTQWMTAIAQRAAIRRRLGELVNSTRSCPSRSVLWTGGMRHEPAFMKQAANASLRPVTAFRWRGVQGTQRRPSGHPDPLCDSERRQRLSRRLRREDRRSGRRTTVEERRGGHEVVVAPGHDRFSMHRPTMSAGIDSKYVFSIRPPLFLRLRQNCARRE